ncbi:DUF6958 family protein [Arcticibacterium luteifluviistationis]|uniref:Uncharacterized protein n=1 Tax=Arcticibacterium luteifluviistationis TaxID=1784714 RepID=A0A2Z4GEJ6_9BACT|nr:hypothetical protein [Arcticibacterium luteifluviistationis]AWV99263.1 hypothetical protein DJ013_14255 [Arcticibacterium luteifluviistationis]
MAKSEKILTLHPEGKNGVNIDVEKYNTLKNYILMALKERGDIAFSHLFEEAKNELQPSFEGKVGWYFVSVKLDLEARGIIERISNKSPQVIRLKK